MSSVAAALWRRAVAAPQTRTDSDAMDGVVLAAIFVAFALVNPLGDIGGDGRIYMGRALADLDPAGVGRDLMFTFDGQSAFSVFRILARTLTAALGVDRAAASLTVLNLATWSIAVAILVRTIVPGRAWLLVLAAALLLPRVYTPWHIISAGESIPQPRPLAEAGVLVALAALHGGRPWLCVAALATAALFHPIMALPGFAVLLVMLGLDDRRWFLGAALGGAAVAVAGSLGVPLASRLLLTFDPAWRTVLVARNPYLFLDLWPIESLTPNIVRAVTIALALVWLDAPARRIVCAACIVASLGVAVAFVLGDHVFDVLVVQLQLWRALWLPTILSTIAAGICLVHLPSRGAAGRIALACLALAWITIDDPTIAPLAALAALGAHLILPRLSRPLAPAIVAGVWACCAFVAGATLWSAAAAARILIETTPAETPVVWQTVCTLRLLLAPTLALAYAWWHRRDRSATRLASFAALGLGLTLLLFVWDGRTPRRNGEGIVRPDLAALLASRGGEVLWTEGDEAWYWLRRANWNSQIQGSSIVFSRDQALLWAQRARAVIDAGLATDYLLAPRLVPIPLHPPPLDPDRIKAFCAQPARPVWIVAPLDADATLPAGLDAWLWSAQESRGKLVSSGETLRWQPLDRYAVIPCAMAATELPRP